MKSLTQRIKQIGKRGSYFALAMVTAGLLGISSMQYYAAAAESVRIEADMASINVTDGDDKSDYRNSVNAGIDDVVQIEMWYHNREQPDSDKIAEDVRLKFNVPNEQGAVQTVSGRIGGTNTNTVTDSNTIALDRDSQSIQYIPGTAKWKYNKAAIDGDVTCQTGLERAPERCYTTVAISDEVVTSGAGVVLEDQNPCNAYEATVTIQVRVIEDVVSVQKYVREVGSGVDGWAKNLTVAPGQTIEYGIYFKNYGNTELEDVIVADNLPKYNSYVTDSTMLKNGNYPDGIEAGSNNVTTGGINVGDYAINADGMVWFKVKVDSIEAYERCGDYVVVNNGFVKPLNSNPIRSQARVTIRVVCDEQPEEVNPVCTNLVLTKLNNKSVKVTVNYDADGTTFEDATINFGDGTDELLTNNVVDVPHTYDELGTYVVTAVVNFTHEDETFQRGGEACKASVNFSTTPTPPTPRPPLPNTGAGEVVGLFAAVTTAGAIAHKYVFTRRIFG